METILEQQRRYHEERERLLDAMVKEMLHKKSGVSRPSLSIIIYIAVGFINPTFLIKTGATLNVSHYIKNTNFKYKSWVIMHQVL